jgi:hypothetical protein
MNLKAPTFSLPSLGGIFSLPFPLNPTGLPMALFICLRHDLRAAAKLARAKTGRFPA